MEQTKKKNPNKKTNKLIAEIENTKKCTFSSQSRDSDIEHFGIEFNLIVRFHRQVVHLFLVKVHPNYKNTYKIYTNIIRVTALWPVTFTCTIAMEFACIISANCTQINQFHRLIYMLYCALCNLLFTRFRATTNISIMTNATRCSCRAFFVRWHRHVFNCLGLVLVVFSLSVGIFQPPWVESITR